jgi:hypothetical protein
MGQNSFTENFLVTVPHPPYSFDLTPSNFWRFGHIKISLPDRVLNDFDELLEAAIEFLNRCLFFTTGSNE